LNMMNRDFLTEIVAHKKELVKKKQVVFEGLKKNIKKTKLTSYAVFHQAIAKPGQVNLIAEIKKASPSFGLIRDDFDLLKLATAYVEEKAAALSILTEDKYFLGKMEYIRRVSDQFRVPVLAKDFFIDECQIYEAFSYRASAILLIVAILKDEELRRFQEVASDLDMDCLVEVHEEKELERALKSGAKIIGVNNRDLHSFTVDLAVSERLIPQIPKDKIIVAESGIKTREDVKRLKALGANAVLIGEALLKAPDIRAKIKEIMEG
jgi:indole-3-glycerol phosphate synthase